MKNLLIISLILISFSCFSQLEKVDLKSSELDSVKTIYLTPLQESKLLTLEKQIQELQEKQKELMELIFDSNKIEITRIRSLKYEKGKFVFTSN